MTDLGNHAPLDDALLLWLPGHSPSRTTGAARTATERSETEARAARRPGGGQAAQLDGGYLTVGEGLEVTGTRMTLCLRLRAAEEGWNGPILARADPADRHGVILRATTRELEYIWHTTPLQQRVTPQWWEEARRRDLDPDFVDGVLRLSVPLAHIGPDGWHDILVRFDNARIELFIDGVLVDEEWPHGPLDGFSGPFLLGAGYADGRLQPGFQGLIERLAIWDRALSDAEITALSGGPEHVARRELEILGPPHQGIQYFKPRGHNAFAGDCIPFWHDGVFHLFYLHDRRHHHSKWSQGAHQYAHATTTDLRHWQHHPLAVPIVEPWECSMGTGDVIFHDGTFHIFYTDCGGRCAYREKTHHGDWIFVAESTDGIHFHKDLQPLLPGGDCEVFQDPETGLFHLIRSGVERLVSADLRNWQEAAGEFLTLREGISQECPNHFEWNGWFYYILGRAGLWRSRSALGPLEQIAPNVYGGLMVPKVAAFGADRRILAGFLPAPEWGGNIVLRELLQDEDGTLQMGFVPELAPAVGERAKFRVLFLRGEVDTADARVSLKATDGLAVAALAPVPAEARITLRIAPGPDARAFGICFRGQGEYQSGCELRFEPGRGRAQWGTPQGGGLAPEATDPWASGLNFAIAGLDCLRRPFTLEAILHGSIIDVCIDGRRTMITRRLDRTTGDRLFLFSDGAEVGFQAIEVRPLGA